MELKLHTGDLLVQTNDLSDRKYSPGADIIDEGVLVGYISEEPVCLRNIAHVCKIPLRRNSADIKNRRGMVLPDNGDLTCQGRADERSSLPRVPYG